MLVGLLCKALGSIVSLIKDCGIWRVSTILPSIKVHHRASLKVYGALEQPPLIEARLLPWSLRTKYTLCSTLESLLTTSSRLTISLFDI